MVTKNLDDIRKKMDFGPKNCIFGPKFCIFLRYTYETPILFFFVFLLDRWAWGPIHCLAHKKVSTYSRDETTSKYHFPGIARRVKEDWDIVNIYSVTGVLVSFILLLSFFGFAGLLVSGIIHHFGGGPVPREFANLWLKQSRPVRDIRQVKLNQMLKAQRWI